MDTRGLRLKASTGTSVSRFLSLEHVLSQARKLDMLLSPLVEAFA